jgi:hypothetical protein
MLLSKALFGCSISVGGLCRSTGGGKSLGTHSGAYKVSANKG